MYNQVSQLAQKEKKNISNLGHIGKRCTLKSLKIVSTTSVSQKIEYSVDAGVMASRQYSVYVIVW